MMLRGDSANNPFGRFASFGDRGSAIPKDFSADDALLSDGNVQHHVAQVFDAAGRESHVRCCDDAEHRQLALTKRKRVRVRNLNGNPFARKAYDGRLQESPATKSQSISETGRCSSRSTWSVFNAGKEAS